MAIKIRLILSICIILILVTGCSNSSEINTEKISKRIDYIVNNASESGKCGEDTHYYYLKNTLVIIGNGEITNNNWWFNQNLIIKEIIIGEGITAIYDGESGYPEGEIHVRAPNYGLAHDNTSLKSVTLPSTLTKIGRYSFYNCTSLKSINITESLTEIGNSAFYNCNSLNKETIDKIKEINENSIE